MSIKVIYLGIFDFIINGYIDIVICVVSMFDKVVLVIVVSLSKKLMFSFDECIVLVEQVMVYLVNVEVIGFSDLMVNFVCVQQVNILICGLWVVVDFEYEMQLVYMNCYLMFIFESVFLMLCKEWLFIFFLLVKEVVCYQGDVFYFLLVNVYQVLLNKLK